MADLNLKNGKTYYIYVKVVDKVGNQSLVGISPEETDVLPWTSSKDKTEVEINSLPLLEDKTCYLSIKAR